MSIQPSELRRLLEREQAAHGVDEAEWIDGQEAHKITRIPHRTLRSKAGRWERQQNSGARPEIRVTATSDSDGAHWRYHRADCLAYAAAMGRLRLSAATPEGPQSIQLAEATEANTADPIDLAARRYADRARRS
jgi:hypothetical protein